jgi:23S rRNA pseudouridine1911/1915/1917 synthase
MDPIEVVVPPEAAGTRLDVFLAEQFPLFSRTQLRKAIADEQVTIEEFHPRAAFKVQPGQKVLVRLPEKPPEGPQPENVPLNILYEDEALIVVNKPPGMVVHPAKGHWRGTLVAGLAYHFEQLSTIGGPTRPGIVHRLDRDTTGVIVVAKTDRAHMSLNAQFEARTPEKEYFCIVVGGPSRDRDLIDAPIGMHPYQREKMAIRTDHDSSRHARTFYEVAERFAGFAAVRAFPHTGRTHQIRVHLTHIGCPIVCDRQYGGRSTITRGELRDRRENDEVVLTRMALHARRLKIMHPLRQEPIEFEAPLPDDISGLLAELRQWRAMK